MHQLSDGALPARCRRGNSESAHRATRRSRAPWTRRKGWRTSSWRSSRSAKGMAPWWRRSPQRPLPSYSHQPSNWPRRAGGALSSCGCLPLLGPQDRQVLPNPKQAGRRECPAYGRDGPTQSRRQRGRVRRNKLPACITSLLMEALRKRSRAHAGRQSDVKTHGHGYCATKL